jgi:hypothetical protein
LGGAGLLAYTVFRKVNALGHLVVLPGQIVSMDFVGGVPVLTITVIAQNTSNSDLLINSFAGNVYSNKTFIGNVSNFFPVAIPGNSSTPIRVEIQMQILGIVNDLIRAFQYGNFTQEIEVEGFANVSSFQLPVKLKFAVGG